MYFNTLLYRNNKHRNIMIAGVIFIVIPSTKSGKHFSHKTHLLNKCTTSMSTGLWINQHNIEPQGRTRLKLAPVPPVVRTSSTPVASVVSPMPCTEGDPPSMIDCTSNAPNSIPMCKFSL